MRLFRMSRAGARAAARTWRARRRPGAGGGRGPAFRPPAPPGGAAARAGYGPRLSAIGAYLWHGQFLSRNRTCQAMAELFGVPVSPGAVSGMVTRITARLDPALEAIRSAVAGAEVAHFDETGFRVAGKLAWVHSASAGNYALITVHPKRGTQGMEDRKSTRLNSSH